MATHADLSGQTFGRLTVRSEQDRKNGRYRWTCQCVCGKTAIVTGQNLKNGHTTSCGCVRNELISERRKTHGEWQSAEYRIWSGMRNRCENKKSEFYADYGGRGVVVCDRWMDFRNFLVDMGRRPSTRHSIDRRDTNGNYEQDNCRWATSTEQNRNRRNNVLYEYQGKRATLGELCELTGVKRLTAYGRLKRGATIEQALNNQDMRACRGAWL